MRFVYTGTNSLGQKIEGKVTAISRDNAQELLANDGITIVEIDIDDDDLGLLEKINIFNRPSATDLIIFCKQMHALLRSGVPIIRAINIVGNSCKNEKLSLTLSNIATRLEAGYAFAVSVQRYHNIFPKLLAALVNVGEQTGTLDKTFQQVAKHLENEQETRKRIKAATRYPVLVVGAILVAMIIMNMVVIPAFSGFFSQFKAELPAATKILIAVSSFTVNYWWLILMGIIGLVVFLISYVKTPIGRFTWDRYKIQIPLIGSIIERSLLSRFASSFALCFRTGIPLLEAISLIAETCDNAYMEKKILEMKNNIERGESMTIAAKNTQLFNSLILQMILIGEESGELDRLLDEIAIFYEQELDYDIKQLSSLIEPILISVMAGMVLVLALGIFLPMWELAKVAGAR